MGGCLSTNEEAAGLQQGASYLMREPDRSKQVKEFRICGTSGVEMSMQGWRSYNEDVSFVLDKGEEMLVVGIFDGHAGKKAAEFASSNLWRMIEETASWAENDTEGACTEGFEACDRAMRELGITCGTTALLGIVTPKEVIVANCGDSRAIITRNGRQLPMSIDHKPSRKPEARRVLKYGGILDSSDSRATRIVSKSSKFSIATSRALGDFDFKNMEANGPGEQIISCLPEFYKRERVPEDEFLLLASDGLWDVMTSPDVASFVTKMKKNACRPQHSSTGGQDEIVNNITYIASALLDTALELNSTDNMTVIIVDLREAHEKLQGGDKDSALPPPASAL